MNTRTGSNPKGKAQPQPPTTSLRIEEEDENDSYEDASQDPDFQPQTSARHRSKRPEKEVAYPSIELGDEEQVSPPLQPRLRNTNDNTLELQANIIALQEAQVKQRVEVQQTQAALSNIQQMLQQLAACDKSQGRFTT
jgi:hypothetical protein